ncbi:outer membrane scaffolding protein for murein synthesis (MipA/OmpV family) [Ancylobacter sp. 3268]|uniref:MipA/OmpV family protein n=1 Tax=Ancylobacter sp. 3268 TaxID=2817752 RepID=UPI002863B0B3|nr:MipA/OmpV family protein [Ancylobacter sp. 3268]MDR6952899.1 outer membrane scaffolding protein for murein synthesis (MipA/OmpV family) [Ancylobacter sp. 3268]
MFPREFRRKFSTRPAAAGLTAVLLLAASERAQAADVSPSGAQPSAVPSTTPPSSDVPASVLQPSLAGGLDTLHRTLIDWQVVLGGGAMIQPSYEGSSSFEVSPVPFVMATFGEHVKFDPTGLSVDVYSLGNLYFSAKLGYDLGRKEDDDAYLRGLGDIDAGAVLGGTVAYEMGPAEFYATFERIVGGSEGTQIQFGVDLNHQVDRFIFTADLSATWADETYMQSYFGVTALQSAASGLPQYQADAGLKRVDLSLAVTYAFDEHWLVRGQAGLGYLLGDAADSPIVQEAFQPSGLIAIGYRF